MLTYQLSTLAAEDLDEILQYTFERFGKKQMLKYNNQLSACLDKISKEDGLYKKIEIDEKTVRSLRCQKHYLFAFSNFSCTMHTLWKRTHTGAEHSPNAS